MIVVACNWIGRRRTEIALSFRITIAGLLAFAVGHLFGLVQVYWAVMTAIIVMQASLGGSLKATADRLVGTMAGAAWGVVATIGIPHAEAPATAAALAVALVPLAVLVALWPNYRVAPLTAAIVLLSPAGAGDVIEAALNRVLEITIGCVVAVAVALAIAPARAHELLCRAVADALAAMQDQLVLLFEGVIEAVDSPVVAALHDRIRSAVERAAAIAAEATHERASHLTGAPDPDPLVRTLRRISQDLVMVARVLSGPLPDPARARLAEPARKVSAVIAAFLSETGSALARRAKPPSFGRVAEAVADYHGAMAALRHDQVTTPLPADDAERIFGLDFALQQLRCNLEELAGRVAEMARERVAE